MNKTPWYEKQGYLMPMPKTLVETASTDGFLVFLRLAIFSLIGTTLLVAIIMGKMMAAGVALLIAIPLLYWWTSKKNIFEIASKRDTIRREIENASPFSVWCEEKWYQVHEHSDVKSLIEWFDEYEKDPFWSE